MNDNQINAFAASTLAGLTKLTVLFVYPFDIIVTAFIPHSHMERNNFQLIDSSALSPLISLQVPSLCFVQVTSVYSDTSGIMAEQQYYVYRSANALQQQCPAAHSVCISKLSQ